MERLRKAQAPVRASFTRAYNMFVDEAEKAELDMQVLKRNAAKLQRLFAVLGALDQQVCDILLDSGCTDVDYALQRSTIECYQDKLVK